MPDRIFFVAESTAVLDGIDLGEPIRLRENLKIGEWSLPARPSFAVGGGFWKIRDPAEYRGTVEATRQTPT